MLYKHIAVLVTCHNRKETTLNFLTSLCQQKVSGTIYLDVYLVDDGSTDGTSEAVKMQFPNVFIIRGNGNLFWGGGMHLAWTEATKKSYDAYLWLNDDTLLLPDAITTLLVTASELNKKEACAGIIIGTCYEPETGKPTYGGRLKKNEKLLTPSDHPQQCDLMNGNIVLIPSCIHKVVGNISPVFRHLGGDNDYGLRAIKAGFKLWIAPGYLGVCESHPYIPWADPAIPLTVRWRFLHGPKGQPPYEVYVYAKRHGFFFWPIDLIKLYFRVIFPGLYNLMKQFV